MLVAQFAPFPFGSRLIFNFVFLISRPVCRHPAGLPFLPARGLSNGDLPRVHRVLLLAVLVAVRLRARRPAASPGAHAALRPMLVPLPLRLRRLRRLPPGHGVPGPRHGNLSNALPLTRRVETGDGHESKKVVYLLTFLTKAKLPGGGQHARVCV